MPEAAHPELIQSGIPELPPLGDLHKRHFGLTPARCKSLAEAARVCLARSGRPPSVFTISDEAGVEDRVLRWRQPTARQMAAHANTRDATEEGAYIVCLSAVEARFGLVAYSRADEPSGADYYVGPPGRTEDGSDDFEELIRLEVSGSEDADESGLDRRLKEKVKQAERGESSLPALAGVVGFAARRIAIARAELTDGE